MSLYHYVEQHKQYCNSTGQSDSSREQASRLLCSLYHYHDTAAKAAGLLVRSRPGGGSLDCADASYELVGSRARDRTS